MTSLLVHWSWMFESRHLHDRRPCRGQRPHGPRPRLQKSLAPFIGQAVKATWQEILARSCARYDGQRQIRTARDQTEGMGLLTAIASISNHNLGNWR